MAIGLFSKVHSSDAYVECYLTPDAMSATLNLYPPVGEGKPLELDYVRQVLDANGVVHGVQEEILQDAILRCNTEHHELKELVVAKGTPPKNESPACITLYERFAEEPHLAQTEGGGVDFKAQHAYRLVHAGELLGQILPKIDGENGTTVTGKPFAFGKESRESLTHGKNVLLKDGKVLAEVSGHFVRKGGDFWVEDHLEIKGSVGYGTGNIEYPGDVAISGEIMDGFRIAAAGSISCASTVDASEILTKKDFFAKQGVIGRGKGIIRAMGEVHAKFVEHCTVEAKGSIFITGTILHCHIYSADKIDQGDKGRIIGGESKAWTGVSSGQFGNEMEVPTIIHAGVNFVAERRLEWARERSAVLSAEIKKLEDALAENPQAHLVERHKALEKEHASVLEMMNAQVGQLYNSGEVVVRCAGKAYPQVAIAICDATYLVTEALQKVRFVYDPASKKISPEKL